MTVLGSARNWITVNNFSDIGAHDVPAVSESDGTESSDSSGDRLRTGDDCSGGLARGIARGGERVHVLAIRLSIRSRRSSRMRLALAIPT